MKKLREKETPSFDDFLSTMDKLEKDGVLRWIKRPLSPEDRFEVQMLDHPAAKH